MALVVSEGAASDYETCPAGLHQAVCADVHDLGMVDTQWGPKHKVALIWAIDELDSKGRPHEGRKVYGFTLSPKGTLRGDLESWRGRAFTPAELLGFDLEKLIGVQAQINILHAVKGDKTYANVMAVLPKAKGQNIAIPQGYIRRKDRQPTAATAAAVSEMAEDDSVPFAWLLPMLLPMTLLGGLVA